MNRCIIIQIFLCLLTLLVCGCERQHEVPSSGKKVKIGVIAPFIGSNKHIGEDGLKGIRTVLHMNPLLENGDEIELVVEDDQDDPELSVEALRKLAEEEQVSAILILSTSAAVLAVNAKADDYGVPIIVLLATHQDIAKNTSYVCQLCFDNAFQGLVAALYVMDELLIERAAVFKEPESFHSTSLADEFVRKYESLDGRITDIIPVYPGTEITETILDVIRENGAELLYLPIDGKKLVEIVKAIEEMGWTPRLMSSDGVLTTVHRLYPEELKLLDGLLAIDLYTQHEQHTAFGEQAVKAYRKLHKDWGGTYAAAGAEGMSLLFHAINRCAKSQDRECINTRLHSTEKFEGLMGLISIQPDGKVERPLIVNTIEDGQLQFVVKVY